MSSDKVVDTPIIESIMEKSKYNNLYLLFL